MLKEFKAFVLRGNLVEIAVAFILGLAFAAVVTAFTNIVLGAIAYVFGSSLVLRRRRDPQGDGADRSDRRVHRRLLSTS